VVVDDRPELGRDGLTDLGDVAQAVQLRGEAVQHVQLRDGAKSIGPRVPRLVGLPAGGVDHVCPLQVSGRLSHLASTGSPNVIGSGGPDIDVGEGA
jgi:hypothetical protein